MTICCHSLSFFYYGNHSSLLHTVFQYAVIAPLVLQFACSVMNEDKYKDNSKLGLCQLFPVTGKSKLWFDLNGSLTQSRDLIRQSTIWFEPTQFVILFDLLKSGMLFRVQRFRYQITWMVLRGWGTRFTESNSSKNYHKNTALKNFLR